MRPDDDNPKRERTTTMNPMYKVYDTNQKDEEGNSLLLGTYLDQEAAILVADSVEASYVEVIF